MDAEVRKIVDAAVTFADASPEPAESALYEDVYSEPYGPYTRSEP
jgi:TPP-dependent pyruvate/acetoin dehydrogenase alpha subunit